jgi:hypothetical protein
MASYSNPSPDTHCEVLYRQTYNTAGEIIAAGLTQNNRVGNAQKVGNARLNASTPLGILAGSIVAVAGDGLIGPCAGDSTATFDKAVGVAVNNAVGNPFESSSAVASGKVVYAHGTGTVLRTDIYETKETDGATDIVYTAGDKLYSSQNGLFTNLSGLDNTALTYSTLIGICLSAPSASDSYMAVQLRI